MFHRDVDMWTTVTFWQEMDGDLDDKMARWFATRAKVELDEMTGW